jgi:hypothetical protein
VTGAVEVSRPTEYFDLRAVSLLGLAEVLRLGGRAAEAAAALDEALEVCREKGDLVDERRARAMLAELES